MPHRMARVLSIALLLPAGLAAQGSVRTILLMNGRDTIAVEEVTRSPTRLEGDLLFRGATQRWKWVATLGPGESITALDVEFRLANDPPGSPARQQSRLAFVNDSVFITFPSPTPPPQRLATTAGALPYVNPSFALVEQAIRKGLSGGRDSATVPLFALAGGRTFAARIHRHGRDSVLVDLGGQVARLAVGPDLLLAGGAVPTQGLSITLRGGAGGAALHLEKPDYSAPADAPYAAIQVRVPTGRGYSLAGTLTLPRGAAARVPGIVTITGSGLEDRDEAISLVRGYRPFREIADALGRRGIAVLRMDDRGFGESGGGTEGVTSRDYADDIRAGLAFLRARPEIDGSRLALLGHSEGGLIAPLVAATDPGLAGIVLLAGPAYTGRRIIEFQNRYGIEQRGNVPPDARDSAVRAAMRSVDSAAAAQPWMKFFLDYDPLPTARTIKVPVLILQGATDQQVTPDQAPLLADAFKAGGNPDVTLRIFPATNHLFLADPDGSPFKYQTLTPATMRPEVLQAIGDWLTRRLFR